MSNSTTVSLKPIQPLEPIKTAIVIGGSSGIGAAIVRLLVNQGYRVAAVARRTPELEALCQEINQDAPQDAVAIYYQHDVRDYAQVPVLFQNAAAELGGLDLIIYAAGHQPPMQPDEYDFSKDQAMAEVNFLGAMAWLDQAAARFAVAKNGQIVAISSIAADRGRRLNPGYNASKAGLTTYMEALRNRLTRLGVTVTTIKPGFVATRLLENSPKTFWVISPEQAANQIYKAIRKRKQVAYVPGRWRFVGLIITHIPSIIFRRLNF